MGSRAQHTHVFARAARALSAVGVLLVMVACSTYGEDQSNAGRTSGRVDGDGDGDDDTPPSGTPTPPPTTSPPPSSGSDASITDNLPDCPPCPAGATCIAAGCKGTNITSTTCDAPFAMPDANTTITAFVCSGGQETTLAAICHGGGTKIGAAFRLGTSTTQKWTISGKGVHWYVATNCGTSGPACHGGNSSGAFGNAQGDYIGSSTLVVGTEDAVSGCVQVDVRMTKG